MWISEAVRILSDGAPLKGFEPPPTSARIQVAWGASTFQSPRRGGNPPAGFFPFPVTCFFRFPKPISETLTRPKRRFRRGSATTRSCSRSLSERNRCLFQEFVKFLDLISVVGDTRDGTEQTFCDGVTADGDGKGQDSLLNLRCEAQHAQDLGHPGTGNALTARDLCLAGNLAGIQEGLPLDGLFLEVR